MPAATIPGPDTAAALRWRGYVLRKGTWSVARDGTWTTSVRPCPPSDAWATVIVPRARLPLAHIENVIRASHMFDLPSTPQWLRIASIRCFGAGRAQAIVGDPASGTWRVVDADRRAALAIHGLHVAATAPRGAGVVHG